LRNIDLIGRVQCDLAEDLPLSEQRDFWRALNQLHSDGANVLDKLLLAERAKVDVLRIEELLVSGYVSALFPEYVNRVRELACAHSIRKLGAETVTADRAELPRIVQQLQELQSRATTDNWRSIFHSWEEFENAPKLQFAIEGFLQESGTTFIAGPAGHAKTFVMLAMARALLDCEPLFGYFKVPRPSARVLYMIPECTIAPFWARVKLFHLEECVRSDRLLIRTLSSKQDVCLTDPRLLKAAEGADVFLDTAVRFMSGAENDVESARSFANTLFGLLAAGARTITGAHHAPKAFTNQEFMSLENVLRGSGDLGAGICTAWGLRQIDAAKNRIYVQNVKPRDFQPCEPFVIEGRPHIDETGRFKMIEQPGQGGELAHYLPDRKKGGRPASPDREAKITRAVELRAHGYSMGKIAAEIGVSKSLVGKWLFDRDLSTNVSGHFVDAGIGTGDRS
jgi:AAA domain